MTLANRRLHWRDFRKPKKRHPRVRCARCGDFVGYDTGRKWELFKAEYGRWMLAGSPPFKSNGKYRLSLARRYRNKMELRGGYLPPTCCYGCRLVLMEKRRKLKAQPGDTHCVVCWKAGLKFGQVVCGKECGITLAKKALTNGISFEVV
jgi:hypothetical protein